MLDRGHMDEGSYIQIDNPCPACGRKLTCDVGVSLGFGVYEPDYPVTCSTCHNTVRLGLPGPPISIDGPRKSSRWLMQGLKSVWRIGRVADLVRRFLDEYGAELFRRRAAQVGWSGVHR